MSDLAKQAISGLVRFQLLFALLLFLPAWPLFFWQAWLYWTLMTAAGLGMALYFLKYNPALVARRLEVGPGAEAQRSQQIIQTIASVLGCAMFVVAALDHRFRWSDVPVPIVLVANAIVMLGMLIVFRTMQANSFTAGTVRVEENQPVISTGPYAWVRHPMYAGSVLGYLATPLALGSLWAFVPAVLFCGVIGVRLLFEERYLLENLPGYDAYRQKVGSRIIPYVW